jgi:predicted RNase H-like nuclease (RuvC/YqgF family)
MVVTRSRAQFWNKLVPSPPKVDCPKMVPHPVSEPKSTEQKLAEALAEITELTAENAELKTKNTGFTDTVKYLEKEVDSWKEQHKLAVDRCNQLHERIVNPFKSAISRPRF